jgi:hypothetical protein
MLLQYAELSVIVVKRKPDGGLFRAKMWRQLKAFHTDTEAAVPLMHQLIDSLYRELSGLLQEPVYCDGLDIFLPSTSTPLGSSTSPTHSIIVGTSETFVPPTRDSSTNNLMRDILLRDETLIVQDTLHSIHCKVLDQPPFGVDLSLCDSHVVRPLKKVP